MHHDLNSDEHTHPRARPQPIMAKGQPAPAPWAQRTPGFLEHETRGRATGDFPHSHTSAVSLSTGTSVSFR